MTEYREMIDRIPPRGRGPVRVMLETALAWQEAEPDREFHLRCTLEVEEPEGSFEADVNHLAWVNLDSGRRTDQLDGWEDVRAFLGVMR